MGRGRSKAGTKTTQKSTTKSVTQVKVQNGTLINLPAPLIYGQKDAAINSADRQKLEAFEAKRKTAKVEYSYILDANGNVIENKRGGKNGVSVSYYANRKGAILSHNHPRDNNEYVMGGTFSDADIYTFCDKTCSHTTMRAAAAEGTYSITKGKNFQASAFTTAFKAHENTSYNAYKTTTKQIKANYHSGSITYSQAKRQSEKAFNGFLIDSHNFLLQNQTKYGYTYTLE